MSVVEPGTLYVVPTPLGNLDDLSLRAAAVLREVGVIAAEDTRVTRTLTQHLGIERPHLVSYHDHNETHRAADLVERLSGGASVALVSDAGTPLISDPGYELVRAALEAEIPVVPLPGPCAVTTALSAGGLPTHAFHFLGFSPRNAGKRRAWLEAAAHLEGTLVFYEAPHRLIASLEAAREVLGDRQMVAAGSLTKRYERFHRGTISEVLPVLADNVRGEWTVLVQGGVPSVGAEVDALVAELAATNLPAKQIRDLVARVFDVKKSAVYQAVLAHREA